MLHASWFEVIDYFIGEGRAMSAYDPIILFEPMISWFEGIEGCEEPGMLDYDNEDSWGMLGDEMRFSESIIDLFEAILFGELITYGA